MPIEELSWYLLIHNMGNNVFYFFPKIIDLKGNVIVRLGNMYMMLICDNLIINMYLTESNLRDVRYKCSEVKDEICVTGFSPTQT